MVGGDDRGDDMAVELSWPDAQPPAGRRPAPAAGALPAATRVVADASREDGPARPTRPDAVSAAEVLSAVQRVGSDVTALARAHKRDLSRAVQELSDRLTSFEQAGGDPSMAGALHNLGERLTSIEAAAAHVDDDRFDAFVDVLASISHRQDELAAAMAAVVDRLSDRSELNAILEWAEHREQLLADRLESIDAKLQRGSGAQPAPAGGSAVEDTLFAVLEHLTNLSSLVTGTSRASSAELDALQRRIAASQVSFDDVRATVHEELAERPLLSDVDVRRIADAVTENLLENVRVEADEGEI